MITSTLDEGVLVLRLARPEPKRVLLLAASADPASGLTAETIAQSLLIGSEHHAEGVRAAREDRSPSFTGR